MKLKNLFAALLLVGATTVSAHDIGLTAGKRVRAEMADGQRITGRLVAWDRDSLTLDFPGSSTPAVIGRSSVVRLETSARQSHAGKGAAIGALTGLAASAGAGLLLTRYSDDDYSAALGALVGVVYFGRFAVPIGALAGAGIGHAKATDKWHTVLPGNDHFRMEIGPVESPGRNLAARVKVSW